MADIPAQFAEALRDRYRLERGLGQGGMATVYLAQDLKHGRPVALKVLRPELTAILGAERFLREIRLTANLQHPHILSLIDSGEAAGQFFYVMPYVEGESLRQRLEREGQLPVAEALRLTTEMAEALDYAHQQGIVHRDIKPENILLTRGHALVADFGIALAMSQAGRDRLTETGLSLGTPSYMSPEQATADPKLDGRTDQYSLGCVVYEMLAGEPPYAGPTAQAVIAKRFSEPIPHLSTVRAVPPGLEAAVTRALATAPADRFATPGEFAAALIAALQPSAAPATAAPARPSPIPRTLIPAPLSASQVSRVRSRRIVAALLLCLGVAAGAFMWAGRHQRAAPGRKMLAVLPLRNLGASTDQYFADGLTEEITSRLAGVSGLGVISRTSADRYRNTSKPLKEIARELGVDYVIEGSVRWERQADGRNHIRVTPELIQVADDSHLWTDRYDADLSDVFRVQGDIAERVTSALNVALADPERRKLAEKPTASLSAYDAYLRGNALYPRHFTEGLDRIIIELRRTADQYREAIRLDSTFALAYAKLGRTMIGLYTYGPREPAVAAAARQAIDRAFALAPTMSEARLARGSYYLEVERDTVHALQELGAALADRPNDAELLNTLAAAEWNARGPASAIPHAERAALLDPQSKDKLLGLAFLYREEQRFGDAERLNDRVIALDSNDPGPYVRKALDYLRRDGDTAGARAIVRSAAQHIDSMALITAAVTNYDLATWDALGMLDEPYQRALLTLRPEAFGGDTAWFGLAIGYTYRARGDSIRFHAYYDTAFATASAKVQERPNDYRSLGVTSWVLAGRGQRSQAYAAMDRARASRGVQSPRWGEIQARLSVMAGDYDRALGALEQRHWGPGLTIPWLCADPFWDPLRSDPRFQRLVQDKCRSSSRPR